MNAYRYIAFPPGTHPTRGEREQFRGYLDLLDRRVAYGKRRSDGGLAICCEGEPFDRLRSLDPDFRDLLLKWQVRGAEVSETLGFYKAGDAWKQLDRAAESAPAPPAPAPPADARTDREREREAAESEGRSRMAVQQAAQRAAGYERLGRRLPYFAWGVAAVAVIAAGAYLSAELLNSDAERRNEQIRRVADDPLNQPLDRARTPEAD